MKQVELQNSKQNKTDRADKDAVIVSTDMSGCFIRKKLSFFQPTSSLRELTMLFEIGQKADITQSKLARMASIVPAMANTYIKQFMKAGYIKTMGKSNRDMRYYLTSRGHSHMMQLMQDYCNETIGLYITAKEEIKERLRKVINEGYKRVVLYGAAETGEIALKAGEELGLDILAVVDGDTKKHGKYIGRNQVKSPEAIEHLKPDAIVISSFGKQRQIYEQIKGYEKIGIAIMGL